LINDLAFVFDEGGAGISGINCGGLGNNKECCGKNQKNDGNNMFQTTGSMQ
jgi:hypothetical protein